MSQAMAAGAFDCQIQGVAAGISWVEARAVTKHLATVDSPSQLRITQDKVLQSADLEPSPPSLKQCYYLSVAFVPLCTGSEPQELWDAACPRHLAQCLV